MKFGVYIRFEHERCRLNRQVRQTWRLLLQKIQLNKHIEYA